MDKTSYKIKDVLEAVSTDPSECLYCKDRKPGDPCSSKKMVDLISQYITTIDSATLGGVKNIPKTDTLPSSDTIESNTIRKAAGVLGCTSESCVITHPSIVQFIVSVGESPATVSKEISNNFKPKGPRNNMEWLSNFDIDTVIQNWAVEEFKDFYPCPFAMMDFERYSNEFGKINLVDVYKGNKSASIRGKMVKRPFRTFGCVLNTDFISGPGKHWVAVFVDMRGKDSQDWVVEYFNSTGEAPPKAVIRWQENARNQLLEFRKEELNESGDVKTVSVTDLEHQNSKSECGLYAMYYIRKRLEGENSRDFFFRKIIPDEAMTEFRKHVFRDK